MVTTIIPAADGSTDSVDAIEVELKEPWLAALLAWMVPGLGHIYQGRTGKGLLFFICVMGTFFYGMYLGGGKVVYAATDWEEQFRWQYFCQLGVGLTSTPMLVQRHRVENSQEPLWKTEKFPQGFMAPPLNRMTDWTDHSGNPTTQPNELAKWTVKYHPNFEIGTVYTVIAGLLNVLVICDAAGGPLLISPHPKKKSKDKDNGSDEKESS
jgi:TM2 domain-containing membrane protein YozV